MDPSDEKPRPSSSSPDEKEKTKAELPVHRDHGAGALAANHGYDASTKSVDEDESDARWRDGWDDARERRVLRKMDIHLLPFVSLLYLLSFLYVLAPGMASPSAGLLTVFSPLGIARTSAMQRSRAWSRTSIWLGTNIISPLQSSSSSTLRLRSRGMGCGSGYARGKHSPDHFSNIALKLLRPSLWSLSTILSHNVYELTLCQRERSSLDHGRVGHRNDTYVPRQIFPRPCRVRPMHLHPSCPLSAQIAHPTHHPQRTHLPRPDRSRSLPRCDVLYLPLVQA